MTTALIYLLVMVLVAALVYLLAATVFGRGEELAPLPPGASPTRLPAADISGDDARAVRFQQAVRGYKVAEVDWVLDRLAGEIDLLRARLYQLEADRSDIAQDATDAVETETVGGVQDTRSHTSEEKADE